MKRIYAWKLTQGTLAIRSNYSWLVCPIRRQCDWRGGNERRHVWVDNEEMIGRCPRTWRPRYSGHCVHTHLFVLVCNTHVQEAMLPDTRERTAEQARRGWMRTEGGLSKHLHAASLHSYLSCTEHKSSYIYTPLGLPPGRSKIYATIRFNPSCSCNLMKERVTVSDVKGHARKCWWRLPGWGKRLRGKMNLMRWSFDFKLTT